MILIEKKGTDHLIIPYSEINRVEVSYGWIANGISIYKKDSDKQEKLWDIHPEDINSINFNISKEVHSMNMYNRIYIPENYRFFFPAPEIEFILITDIGNIKTSLSHNGYICKGLRQWFAVNGPIMPEEEMIINLVDEENNYYEMFYEKLKKIK